MNRKIIIYLCAFAVTAAAVCMYYFSKEMSDENAVITGEYNIWETNESIETQKDNYTSLASEQINTETKTKESSLSSECLNEKTAEQDQTEFLYININIAGIDELMMLDGIGEVTAEKIIEYRLNNGYFKNIEEIMNVNGIGEKTFFNIREHIYVENPIYQTVTDPYEQIQDYYPEPPVYNEEQYIPPTESVNINIQESLLPTEIETRVLLFDLNNVTREELLLIPEIDEKTADSIISLRTSIKYFSNTYELLYAEGMSDIKLKKIINYFYVDNYKK